MDKYYSLHQKAGFMKNLRAEILSIKLSEEEKLQKYTIFRNE